MSFLARVAPTNVFPVYLVPSIPFHRRRNPSSDSTNSALTTVSSNSPSSPGAPSSPYLRGSSSHLRCARCATDLCLTSQIISKGFTGRHGRAYLVSPFPNAPTSAHTNIRASHFPNLPNTHIHKAVPRQLVTGAHTVSDVSCMFCGSVIGWKYESAEEEGQRYKVGKFILETKKIFESCSWEGEGGFECGNGKVEWRTENERKDVEFDSQDEDECEDLFAGVWTPALAMRRRQGKNFGKRG